MPKPRYDEQKDETRHGAANQERCLEMENKHGWELKNVEYTQDSILSVDCIFDGYCEFPPEARQKESIATTEWLKTQEKQPTEV